MATNDHFKLQGYLLEDEGSPDVPFWIVNRNGVNIFEADNEDVFGEDAYRRLFEQRGSGYWDCQLMGKDEDGDPDYDSPVKDKELALYRIDRQIEQYEKVAS